MHGSFVHSAQRRWPGLSSSTESVEAELSCSGQGVPLIFGRVLHRLALYEAFLRLGR
jgi:hypothetical protein